MIFPNYIGKTENTVVVDRIKQAFQSFIGRRIKLFIISSESEIGNQYLQGVLKDIYFDMEGTGLLKTEILTQTDHDITPLKSQNKIIESISEWCQFVESSSATNASGTTGSQKMSAT